MQAVKNFLDENSDIISQDLWVIPTTCAVCCIASVTVLSVDPVSATAFAALVATVDLIATAVFNEQSTKAAFTTFTSLIVATLSGSTLISAVTYFFFTVVSAGIVNNFTDTNEYEF